MIQNPEDLLHEVDEIFEEAIRVARKRELRLTENLAFLRGYQWGVPLRNGLYEDFAEIDPRLEAEVNNYLSGVVAQFVARGMKVPLNFKVSSAFDDALGIYRARKTETLLRSLLRTGVLDPREDMEVLAGMATLGAAWKKTFWNPTKGRADPVTGQLTGEIDQQYVSILEVFPDPRATREADMRFLCHPKLMPVEQAEETWSADVTGKPTAGRFRERGLRTTPEAILRDDTGADSYAAAGVLVEIREYWEKPSLAYPKGRLIIYSADLVLFAGDLPYRFPWVLYQGPNKAPGVFYADGLVHHLKSIQRSINLAASKAREAVNIALNPPILVPDTAGIQEDRFTNIIGEIIPYSGLKEPHWMAPPPLTGMLADYQAVLQKIMSDISSFGDVATGKTMAPGTSARAIGLMADLNQAVHVPTDLVFRLAQLDSMKIVLDLVKSYSDGRLIQLTGERNSVASEVFKRSDYDLDVELIVDVYAPMEYSPAVRRAEIGEYFGMGLFDDAKPGAAVARKLMDLNSEESSSIDLDQAHKRRAEREDAEFELIARGTNLGPPPQVLPQDNDDIHLACHEHTSITNWLAWPPEIQSLFMMHIQEHEMQRQGKMGQFTQEQQALSGKAPAQPPTEGRLSPPDTNPQQKAESPMNGGHGAPMNMMA